MLCTLGRINPQTGGLELDIVTRPNENVLHRNWNLIILFVLTCLVHFHQYCIHLLGGESAASLGWFSECLVLLDGFRITTDEKPVLHQFLCKMFVSTVVKCNYLVQSISTAVCVCVSPVWKARQRLTWTHGMYCTVISYKFAYTSQTFLLRTTSLFLLLKIWNKCYDGRPNIVPSRPQLSIISSFPFLFFVVVSVSLVCVSVPWPCYICLWHSVTLVVIPYSPPTFILYFLSPSVYKSLHPSLISSQHILTGQRANVGYSVLMAEH